MHGSVTRWGSSPFPQAALKFSKNRVTCQIIPSGAILLCPARVQYIHDGNSCFDTTILEQDLFYSSYTLLSLSRVTSFSAQTMKGSLEA
jgi:hypothetical protein